MTPNFRVARLVHNQAGAANSSIIWQCTRLKDSFTFSQNGVASSQISQEGLRRVIEAGKHAGQIGVAEVARNGLTQHTPEIGCERKVPTFVELRRVEAGPAAVNPAPAHRSANDEHDIGMPVVGAAIAVFAGRASEL